MSTRTELAAHLAVTLGARFWCIPAVKNIGPIPPQYDAAVVVDAPTYAPASNAQGALVVTFDVHVVIGVADPEAQADTFDEVLELVFAALDADESLVWTEAKPDQYDEQKPSYLIKISTIAQKG